MYRYIKAFSFPKRAVKEKLQSFSAPVVEHLAKIIIYSNDHPEYILGWIDDMSKAIYNASKLSPKGGKLTSKDYQENLFADMGDNDMRDADATLSYVEYYQSHKQNNPFNEVEITSNMIHTMVDMGNEIRDIISEKLSSTNSSVTIPQISSIVRNIVSKYIQFQ